MCSRKATAKPRWAPFCTSPPCTPSGPGWTSFQRTTSLSLAPARQFAGTLNGQPFESIVDADPRIGPRLELFAAGSYMWIPFEHIESIELQAPSKLRDLLWIPALVRTGPSFKDTELGEVLIPVQYPKSFAHENDNVRLGRETHWQEVEGGEPIPVGQKLFLVDGEEFPLLEVRKIEFTAQESAAA